MAKEVREEGDGPESLCRCQFGKQPRKAGPSERGPTVVETGGQKPA